MQQHKQHQTKPAAHAKNEPAKRQPASTSEKEMADSPKQAVESGEPRETGRTRGQVLDNRGRGPQGSTTGDIAPESGRHKSTAD